MKGNQTMFEIFRGFSVKIIAIPARASKEKVNKLVMFANKTKIASVFIGTIKDETVAKYPSIQEIKTKGPVKVISASIDFLFGRLSRLPYLKLTSMVPRNHRVRCLKNPERVEGYSCQDFTSEA